MKRVFLLIILVPLILIGCTKTNTLLKPTESITQNKTPPQEPEKQITEGEVINMWLFYDAGAPNKSIRYQGVMNALQKDKWNVNITIKYLDDFQSVASGVITEIQSGTKIDMIGLSGSRDIDQMQDVLLPINENMQLYTPYLYNYCSTNPIFNRFIDGTEKYIIPTTLNKRIPIANVLLIENSIYDEYNGNLDDMNLDDYFELVEFAHKMYPDGITASFSIYNGFDILAKDLGYSPHTFLYLFYAYNIEGGGIF